MKDGTDPDYQRAVHELESMRDNRIFVAEVFRQYELAAVEQEFENEKTMAIQQFEVKQQDLKECLLQDLQDKRKAYESYRHGVEVSSICKSYHLFVLSPLLSPRNFKVQCHNIHKRRVMKEGHSL